jgi:hypothetical protein
MGSVVERRPGRIKQPRENNMNMKQQLATGFLALVIVVSIAFMPVSAEEKNAPASAPRVPGTAVASLNTTENPQDQVRDLTYN